MQARQKKNKAESDKVKGRRVIFLCIYIYKGLPPMKSDHLRTSGGMPSLRGSFSLMQRAKSSAVYLDTLVYATQIK
jgi:hypothetical protein